MTSVAGASDKKRAGAGSEVDGEELLADLHDGKWLDSQTFPPLRYHVPGIVCEGSTLLVGPPKIGKSYFVLGVGLGVACGGYVLGNVQVDERPVLYLALEDGDRRLQDRCRKLLGDKPIPESFEYLTRVDPGRVRDTITAWLARHDDAEPFVVLDTLGKVMPPALLGESPYQRDYRVGSALKRIVDDHPGSALVVNHHDRKAYSDDFVDSVSGTHGLAGAADTIIVLTRPRQETAGLLRVTGRDVAEGEYAVNFIDGSVWKLDGDSCEKAASAAVDRRATAGLGDTSALIIGFVRAHPDGVDAAAVAAALDITKAKATTYLSRAVEKGRLARPSRGLYAPVRSVSLLEDDRGSSSQDHTSNTPLEDGPS